MKFKRVSLFSATGGLMEVDVVTTQMTKKLPLNLARQHHTYFDSIILEPFGDEYLDQLRPSSLACSKSTTIHSSSTVTNSEQSYSRVS